MLYRLIYSSTALLKDPIDDLNDILDEAIRNNVEKNVTGLLIFRKHFFLQMLEGEVKDINDVFDKIRKDDRHYNIVLLDVSEISKRFFEDWSMKVAGFADLSDGLDYMLTEKYDLDNCDINGFPNNTKEIDSLFLDFKYLNKKPSNKD